jgi:hypothetical protein
MMARITTTTQKKNTMMPGMAYPATVFALATTASYPPPRDLLGAESAHEYADVMGLAIVLFCSWEWAALDQRMSVTRHDASPAAP